VERVLELCGIVLAKAYAFYGLALLASSFAFANFVLLGAVAWSVAAHGRGAEAWPWLPPRIRRAGRLGVETAFGLINPVVYLLVLEPALPAMRGSQGPWHAVLTSGAWTLLAAFWAVRVAGAAFDPRSRLVRAGVRTLLSAALFWLALFAAKDAWLLAGAMPAGPSPLTLALLVPRLCPLYLVPAVLLWDYIRAGSAPSGLAQRPHGFFLLPGRAARVVLAAAAMLVLVSAAAAAHRRSDASVRRLVASHRGSIRAAADQYDVDPRLIASIVYVTHRDQLTPFRDALERVVASAWAMNLREVVGIGPPDRVDTAGTDENPLLNRVLDVSVGLAQIKPRTAQTASVLAMGLTPDELPRPTANAYRDVEPVGENWRRPGGDWTPMVSPVPVPAFRREVAAVLLDDRSNLAMCALILALYQRQWESANRDWSRRERPEILATLYQIGFARSRPHAAPRSNAFGSRVRAVLDEPWLGELGFSSHARSRLADTPIPIR
jgi:hypothetical protein